MVAYEYTRSVGAHGVHAHMQFDAMLGSEREIWVGSDQSGLICESRGPVTFFTEYGKRRWEAAGSPTLEHGRDIELYAPGCLSDPRTWRRRMAGHPDGIAVALAEIVPLTLKPINSLLGEGLIDPAFCRSVFEVAEQLPGVERVDDGMDQTGRRGPGLAQIIGVHRTELIFSSDLSHLLAYQHFFSEPMEYAPAGALHSWCAFLERRIEPSLPAGVPPVPSRFGDRARAGQSLRIHPDFSITTGSADDPLSQLADLHDQRVLSDEDYESAKTMHAWAGFDDATAAAWRALGLSPAEAIELTHAGSQPAELGELWAQTGIPQDEIAEWIGAGLTPGEAVAQRAQGVTTEDAAGMRSFRRFDAR